MLGFVPTHCPNKQDFVPGNLSFPFAKLRRSVPPVQNSKLESDLTKLHPPLLARHLGGDDRFRAGLPHAPTASPISGVFNNLASKAGQAGSEIMNAFLGGIKSVISNILSAIKNLVDQVSSLLKSGINSAKSAGTQTANAYMQGLNSAQPSSGGGGLFSLPFGNPSGGGGGGGGFFGGGGGGAAGGALVGAINELNRNLERYGSAQPANVNVELVGSAKNIFDTVRVQNNRLQTATGYHALA